MILGNFWNPGVAVRRRPVSLCQGGIVASGPQCRCYTKEVVGATLEISRMKTKWVSKHWLFVTCSYFFTHLCCFFPHSSSSSPCFASCSLRGACRRGGRFSDMMGSSGLSLGTDREGLKKPMESMQQKLSRTPSSTSPNLDIYLLNLAGK